MRAFITVVLLSITLFALDIEVYTDYNRALNEAKYSKKVLLIYLYQEGCSTCTYMDQEVFTDKKVETYINNYYTVLHVKSYTVSLPKRFYADMSPVFHFVNPEDGSMIESIIGGRNPNAFLSKLQKSYLEYKDDIN